MNKQAANREDRRSPNFRAAALAALKRWNANQTSLPKCGANRKKGAGICQQPALANGRCRWHGGSTPRGDGWHRPVWPNGNAPATATKLFSKLRALEKAAKARAAKLREMTDEERRRHDAWHAARPTGSAKERAERKRLKEEAKATRKLLSGSAPKEAFTDPDYMAICHRIAELRAKLEALHASHTAAPAKGPATLNEGVFG